MKPIVRIAPDVGWLPVSFSNVYFIGRPGSKWVLIDAGPPGCASEIVEAAEARFGTGSRPEAILLTHGHADHVGSALALAEKWDITTYAHHLELPYLTGKSPYPPADPTVGGAMAFLSRFFPARTMHLGKRIRALPHSKVPGLTGWEWIAAPGHSPGQVAFFRESDRVLLAGDAIATMDLDSWSGLPSGRQQLSRPPSPFTCDWDATRASLQTLSKLRPNVLGCGHGIPLSDPGLPDRLEEFTVRFRPPRRDRYVREPAHTDENGIVDLPTAPFDPVPFVTMGALVLVGIALGAGYFDEERD